LDYAVSPCEKDREIEIREKISNTIKIIEEFNDINEILDDVSEEINFNIELIEDRARGN